MKKTSTRLSFDFLSLLFSGRNIIDFLAKSKISSRFDYFACSMRWGNVSIESDL